MKTSKVKKLGKSEPAPLKKKKAAVELAPLKKKKKAVSEAEAPPKKKKKLKKEVEALLVKKSKKVKAKKPPLKQKIGQESIIIRERVYIPIHMVNTNDVKDAYTTKRYDKNACRKCENLPDRHSYLCDSCPAYLGEVRLFAKKTIKGRSYIGIPVGDKKHFERKTGLLFDECEFVDRRVYAPFHYKIKFLAELRDYQDSVITDFLKKKYGLLKAPPRTGKCVVGDTYIHTPGGMSTIASHFKSSHGDGVALPHKMKILGRSGVDETSHIYKERVSQTIRVTTTHGYGVRGTPKHPMLVLTENLNLVWKELKDIELGDVLCVQRKNSMFAGALPTGSLLTRYAARLLGYLTANGGLTVAKSNGFFTFCTENTRVQDDFLKCARHVLGLKLKFVSKHGGVHTVTLRSSETMETLENLGLKFTHSRKKRIPKSILTAPKKYVTEYLNAYFSCDSWLPTRTTDPIQLCSASPKLINQLHILLLQYGIVGKRWSGISWARNSTRPVKRRYHNIFIQSTEKNNFYQCFDLLKATGSISGREATDSDRIPNLGFWLSSLHRDRYLRTSVYKTHTGEELTTHKSGKLIKDHAKSPSELPEHLNYRVAAKVNRELLQELSPKFEAKLKLLLREHYFFDRVSVKKIINTPVDVYDVAVPDSHSFIANGLVSHNTLMSLYIGLQLGQRMLFLANQHEFVEQFIDHIHGNEAEGIPKCTNLPELEEKYGKKLYGTPKTDEDFENFQFFAMTYQAFISEKNGKNRFKKLTPHIGTVGVDEVDKSAAKEFSKVIGKFRTRYRFGVSGTIVRKDGMDFVTRALIGPVVAESKRESLTPTVILHDTGIKCNKSFQGKPGWVKAMQFLAKEKARNKLIVEWVIKDLAKGHNIVIPTYFKGHVDALMNAINDAYGKDICGKFVGGAGKKNKAERKAILSAAKAGKIRCIVGIRSLLQRGLNVPQWSAIYLQAPISNEPNLMQETSRVRTPLEEKRSPIIRLFFDQEVGQSIGCARNTIKHMKGFKYEFMKNEKQAGLLYTVLGSSRESDPYKNSDDDNFVARKSMFEGRAATRIPVKRL